MSQSESKSEIVLELAEEFVERYRKGERPPLREYIERYPALAAEIKEVFPAMAMMEKIAVADESLDSSSQQSGGKTPTRRALQQLGDYRIIRQIGHGGMGLVYEAEQVSLGRHVALKVLPDKALLDPKHKRRFEREAKAAAKLHHTNIVPVFGVGEHEGLPYYVMQFIQGLGLDAVLVEMQRMQPGAAPVPSGLPTSGEMRVARRDISAALVARSLMTGEFQSSASDGPVRAADPRPAILATVDEPAECGVGVGSLASKEVSGPAPHHSSLSTPTGHSADSLTASSSSITLPAPTGSGSKAAVKKHNYWQSVAHIGRQVADALDYAHKQGVLHRDIKPSNLLLDLRGTVWVTDFGLAKVSGPGAEGDNLTHTGDILGTLRYMPPEAFNGRSDARGDIYSLGLTLYEMLILRPAYQEKGRHKLIKQVTTEEPVALDRVNEQIPRDLVTIIHKAIDREPSRRYATAVDFASDLQRFLDDEPILARRQTQLERCVRWARHNPGIAALGAILTAVLVLATITSLIVASRMANLARSEAQSADDERRSHQEAVVARKREADQRIKAEAAEETGRKLLYTTDMQLAPFVWRDDRTTAEQVRVLLAKHIPDESRKDEDPSSFPKPDLRGFEWHYYQHLLESNAAVFSEHGVAITDIAFASNGQLVTLDQNGQVRRWDMDSQDEDTRSRRDLPSARVGALSPNGRLAALAEGSKVHVLDTATGKETFRFDSATHRLRRLLFSRDGDRLVIFDKKIRWCNASGGEVIASVDQQFNNVYSLALSADGRTLAVVGYGRSGQQFSIFRLDTTARTLTPLATDVGAGSTLYASALSPDGRRVAVGAKLSGSVFVYDTATGRSIARHESAHASPVSAMAFSGDGAKLVTADAEGTIKIWADAEKLSSNSVALLTLKGHRGAIRTVGFSSDGKQAASVGIDKTARVWDLENAGAAIRPLEGTSKVGWFVARYSSDGQWIACAGGSRVRLWDAATGRLVRELSAGDKSSIYSVAFSPTNNRLLAVGHGGQAGVSYVALWDIDAGTQLARLPGATDLPDFQVDEDSGAVGALAFSPDGKCLAAGFGSKKMFVSNGRLHPLKVWDVGTRRLIRRLNGHRGYCVSLDFSRDGKLLASGSRDGTAIIWSTETWKATRTLANPDKNSLGGQSGQPGMVEDVAFSPDSKTLALASREGNVQLLDVASGKLETLKGHSSAANAVAFSPDGRTLASGSSDRTVRLWNVQTRRQLMQLDSGRVELGPVRTLAFSPDGKHLLAGGSSTAFWSAAPIVWNDSDRAAEKLRLLLQSNADFPSRIRMLPDNRRVHEALEKLDSNDVRVQAALSATRANWHASRQEWRQAAQAFEQLKTVAPHKPETWFDTPGLLRLATALLHENRPLDAAGLLTGGALLNEPATAKQVDPLRAAVDERLAKMPQDAGLLQLRAAIAGHQSTPDFARQVADYTAAIKNLTTQPAERAAAHLRRLYHCRGDAYVGLKKWQEAFDDYAHVVTDQTMDVELLSKRALTEVMLTVLKSTVLDPKALDCKQKCLAAMKLTDPWQKLAALYRIKGDQQAIDQLVEGHPTLAGPIGDVFIEAKDQDWRRAISLYSKGITADTTDALLLAKRARAHEALSNWDAATADWSRAATGNPDGAKWLAEFARRLAGSGRPVLAKAQFEKSRAVYEHLLQADPENDLVAVELAQLLLDQHENENLIRWTVLKPTKMKSKGDATLTRLDDHSILAGGVNPRSDQYTVDFIVPQKTDIQSIRLEALTHSSLPGQGPGRGVKGGAPGWFELNRFDWTAKGPDSADGGRSLSFRAVCADYSWGEDGDIRLPGHWNITWGSGKDRASVWRLTDPIPLKAGSELRLQMGFNPLLDWSDQNLGRFRLSVSSDPAAFARSQKRFTAMKLTDPWAKLAAVYHVIGNQRARDDLLKHHPEATADLYAAEQDWERAIAEYSKVLTDRPDDEDLSLKLAAAYQAAGRTREAVAHLAKVSAANPQATILSLKVAALQVWFGQEKEFAATLQRIFAYAKGNDAGPNDAGPNDRAAKACSLLPSTDKAQLEAALAFARTGVEVDGSEWTLMTLGMAEYRSGNDTAAEEALRAAMEAGPQDSYPTSTSAFYRAMTLLRQGKPDEAKKLATAAAAEMKPLPKDAQNPLADNANENDLILWLAYREAKQLIQFDFATPPKADNDKK
jgi:eukaryotic-like serine/threonine-protein kinase